MATSFTVHLKQLVLQKAANTGETITMTDVQRETGLSPLTIRRWYSGTVKRVEAETLVKLSGFLSVGISDLITIEGVQS